MALKPGDEVIINVGVFAGDHGIVDRLEDPWVWVRPIHQGQEQPAQRYAPDDLTPVATLGPVAKRERVASSGKGDKKAVKSASKKKDKKKPGRRGKKPKG
jgi:hypothetical protein